MAVLFIYLWLASFIMLRYIFLARRSTKEAKYRLVLPKSNARVITSFICNAIIFCLWPLLFLIFPADCVGAFIFNKKKNFNMLFARMGWAAGFTVAYVKNLFK